MKVWPDADGTLVRRYLRTLGLRNSDSQRCVLNNFQRFVAGRVDDKPLSVSTVESWVRERASEWSLRTLVAGARSVNRFLNWLVADNVLADNPWFDLCQQYGQRTAPVIRAILRPDTAQALEALRPLPRFGSHLGQAMLQHVKRMRSLGFRYEREASRLLAFDRYLQQRTGASAQPLPRLIREYADLASTPEARLEKTAKRANARARPTAPRSGHHSANTGQDGHSRGITTTSPPLHLHRRAGAVPLGSRSRHAFTPSTVTPPNTVHDVDTGLLRRSPCGRVYAFGAGRFQA
jgi:hypothetical protein